MGNEAFDKSDVERSVASLEKDSSMPIRIKQSEFTYAAVQRWPMVAEFHGITETASYEPVSKEMR